MRQTYAVDTPFDSTYYCKLKEASEVARFTSSLLFQIYAKPPVPVKTLQANIVAEIRQCRKFGDEKKLIPQPLQFRCNQILWQR